MIISDQTALFEMVKNETRSYNNVYCEIPHTQCVTEETLNHCILVKRDAGFFSHAGQLCVHKPPLCHIAHAPALSRSQQEGSPPLGEPRQYCPKMNEDCININERAIPKVTVFIYVFLQKMLTDMNYNKMSVKLDFQFSSDT